MTTTLELPSVELYRLLGSVAPFAATEDPGLRSWSASNRIRLSINPAAVAGATPIVRTMACDNHVFGIYRHELTANDHADDDDMPVHDVTISREDVAAMMKLLKSAGGRKFTGTSRLTLESGTGELSTMGFGDHALTTTPPGARSNFSATLARVFAPTTERRTQSTAAITVDTALFSAVLKAAAAVNVTIPARDVGEPLTWWPGQTPSAATGFMVGERLAGAIMPWGLPEGESRRARWVQYSTETGWPAGSSEVSV